MVLFFFLVLVAVAAVIVVFLCKSNKNINISGVNNSMLRIDENPNLTFSATQTKTQVKSNARAINQNRFHTFCVTPVSVCKWILSVSFLKKFSQQKIEFLEFEIENSNPVMFWYSNVKNKHTQNLYLAYFTRLTVMWSHIPIVRSLLMIMTISGTNTFYMTFQNPNQSIRKLDL